jgi:hypothetical protein
MAIHGPIRADHRWQEECIRYSICTIVTRPDQYAEMVDSFRNRGFEEPNCEFLFLDNSSGNAFDAYTGNNVFLNVARGQFVVLCHQDVLLLGDGRETLDRTLDNLSRLDSTWGICGNAGVNDRGPAIRITDPYGVDQKIGELPAKVRSLDENFLIVRRSANVALSRDLHGFHLYGTDICLVADVLGYSCYVIDFHLLHKSAGVRDDQFYVIRSNFVRKYKRAFRSRWIKTTCTTIFISGIPLIGYLLSSTFAIQVVDRFKRLTCRSSRNIPT